MPETTSNTKLEELSRSTDASEQALARYRAHPTTDNMVNCVLSYATVANTRIGHLTDRLATAEAEIRALRTVAVARPERSRLRPNSLPIPTAPQAGG